jgi:uncharacterized membrane protein
MHGVQSSFQPYRQISTYLRQRSTYKTIGLLTAVPAALTGVWEFVELRRRQGYYKRDTGKLSEKARVSLIHAGFSVLAIVGAFATWFVSGPGQREDFWLKAVDTISTGFLLYGAKLGGMLAFQYGMGFAVNKQK